MPTLRNLFACLVHESQPCVIDLVRNLRYLDPDSTILLYNGGRDPQLLAGGFPFAEHGAVLHPQPRPLAWGSLHNFALDCMRFALDHLPFDTLTVVDSDQLAVQPGWSSCLARFLEGRPGVGLLGNCPSRQSPHTTHPPSASAHRETERWRPFLRRFPGGEDKWVHWTFWPTTVFTAAAARDLTQLFDTEPQLQELVAGTQIRATEEVILPTLVALLGHELAPNPCSNDFVRFRVHFPLDCIDAAVERSDVFWIHPIPRHVDNPARSRIRAHFNQYQRSTLAMPTTAAAATQEPGPVLILPLLARMKNVEGWFSAEEADLLAAVTAKALRELPSLRAVVEVGSYCGRSTVVLGGVVQALGAASRVYAIDPHDGVVGARDQGLQQKLPTFERFRHTIEEAGLGGVVEPIRAISHEVHWDKPIALLLIDALHDYDSVANDFNHFDAHVYPGGYVAFHDYADYFPGVKKFVDELLGRGQYRAVRCVGSLMVVRKVTPARP